MGVTTGQFSHHQLNGRGVVDHDRVMGPLPLDLVGILASIADPLAEAKISIFAISTYDTDYVLVKARDLEAALGALERAGHRIKR